MMGMFKRLIVLVRFNGFEKVTPKQKYELAKLLNNERYEKWNFLNTQKWRQCSKWLSLRRLRE